MKDPISGEIILKQGNTVMRDDLERINESAVSQRFLFVQLWYAKLSVVFVPSATVSIFQKVNWLMLVRR